MAINSTRPLHPFDDLPLGNLDMEDRLRILTHLEPLVKFLGSPGDWGYDKKIGVLTIKLIEVRQQLLSEQ